VSLNERVPPTQVPRPPLDAETLGRGELCRLAWRLARSHATGVLTIFPAETRRPSTELLVLRRGQLVSSEAEPRAAFQRLERLAGLEGARAAFDGGVAAYPPGMGNRAVSLGAWARQHLEAQLDSTRANKLVAELAGMRLAARPELAPEASACDETDRRILAAMAQPRRLDQIWPLARTPRFRLLTFIHFLRSVGALMLVGVAAPAPEPTPLGGGDLHRLLGVSPLADRETVKRAYRRLVRALHPDLQADASAERRRLLERRLAEITTAYRALTTTAG
jgi:DnaJ-domain-containing protein 1